jgi:hypothetical protein
MSAEPPPAPPRPRTHWLVWLFAFVGLLGIIAFVMIAIEIFGSQPRVEPATVASDASAIRFVVRDASPIHGTNLVQIVISAGSERSPYSSGGMDDQRNILLLDRTNGAVRRLLPDNERHIVRSYFLPAQAEAVPTPSDALVTDRDDGSAAPPTPPPAYFALLVAQPDNGERLDLMIGTLAGDAPMFTMPGLAGVDAVWMQSPTQVAMLVREGLNLFYRIVDIPSRRVVLSQRVAI